MGLLGADAVARLADPVPLRLGVADLEVGRFGVLELVVDQVHPPRVFQRKRGGEGTLCRVSLSDATGTLDLVLWDDELRLARDGPLWPGAHIVLRGATVKAGYRGGLELGLGSAVVEEHTAAAPGLYGRLVSLGPTQVVDHVDGPRFKAEAEVATDRGDVQVVAWDEAVKALQGGVGGPVALPDAVPHPALPDRWIAGRAPS